MAIKTDQSKPKSTAIKAINLGDKRATEGLKIALIDYYRQNRVLWDPQHEDNKDQDLKNRLLSDFITTFYDGYESVTVDGLRKTWKSLFDAFNREHKKHIDRSKTGDPGTFAGKDVKKWVHYDEMLFLKEPNNVEEELCVSIVKQPSANDKQVDNEIMELSIEENNDKTDPDYVPDDDLVDDVKCDDSETNKKNKKQEKAPLKRSISTDLNKSKRQKTEKKTAKMNNSIDIEQSLVNLGSKIAESLDKDDHSSNIDSFQLISNIEKKIDIIIDKLSRLDGEEIIFLLSLSSMFESIKDPLQLIKLKSEIYQLFFKTISDLQSKQTN